MTRRHPTPSERRWPHLAAGLTLLVLSTFGVRAADAPGDAARRQGEAILQEKCARCHAIGASGSSPHQAAPPFRELSARYPVGHLAEAFAEGITTGHPDMPEFAFSSAEIEAILAYIEHVSTKPRAD